MQDYQINCDKSYQKDKKLVLDIKEVEKVQSDLTDTYPSKAGLNFFLVLMEQRTTCYPDTPIAVQTLFSTDLK